MKNVMVDKLQPVSGKYSQAIERVLQDGTIHIDIIPVFLLEKFSGRIYVAGRSRAFENLSNLAW